MPAAFVPRLFERYSQGSSTASGGSGLGLSVVRDLVSAHHGTVRYDLARNTFIFTLPPPPLLDVPAVPRSQVLGQPAAQQRPVVLEQQREREGYVDGRARP